MKLTREHWMLLAGFLAATGAVISGLHTWSEALKPGILGGLIVQLGLAVRMIYTSKPGE